MSNSHQPAKISSKTAATLVFATAMAGCGRHESVKTVPSPNKEVFCTVETSFETGPVSNDTRVYAHFSHNGKARKTLVLNGEDIEDLPIIWTSPTDVDICVGGGLTDTFRNQVTLIIGDDPSASYTIHNHLKEHC